MSSTSQAHPRIQRPTLSMQQQNALATAKGGGFLAVGTIFEFAARFLIALLLARLLGPQDYGLYVLSLTAAGLFTGISLVGLDDALVRYAAILSGRNDRAGLRGALQISLGVPLAAALFVGATLFLTASPVAEGLFEEPRLASLLRLFAVVVPFLTVSNVLAGTARGLRRMDYAAFAENIIQSVVRIVLLAGLALIDGLSLFAAGIVFGVSDIVATITLIILLKREPPLAQPPDEKVRRDFKPLLRFALPLWLSGLLRQFRRNIEILMLGALSGVSSAGVYAIVSRINLVGHVSLLSILVAVRPILAQLHDCGDRDGLSHLYRTATRWALTLNIPFFLIVLLHANEILGMFGDSFAVGTTSLIVVAVAELVNAGTGICGPMIDMTGHTRVKLANSVLWTILTIGAGALFIPRWGVVGAAVASLIGIAATNILAVVELWVLERVRPFDRTFCKPVLAALAALGSGLVLRSWAPDTTGLGLVAQAVTVSAVYAGIVVLLGLEPEDKLVASRTLHKARALIDRRRPLVGNARRSPQGRIAEVVERVPFVDSRRPETRGPIYVGGLDRSGKTTMSAFLTSHPNIAIPPIGSNMWTYFFRQFGDLAETQNLESCLQAMLRYKHVRLLDPEPERIRREFEQGPRTYGRLFALFLMHYAERQGKARWGAQTGLIERYADDLFEAYPGVKVVHMVRDPRDRYEASLELWPHGKGRAGGATARWRYSMELARRNVRRYPDDYTVVRYEDLVLRTEGVLRDVFSFLGEPFDPRTLAMGGAPERRARLRARSTRSSNEAALSDEFIGRFRGRIPPLELTFIQFHAGPMMKELGYQPERLQLSPRTLALFAARTWPNHFGRMVAWRAVEALQQQFPAHFRRRPDRRMIIDASVGSSS